MSEPLFPVSGPALLAAEPGAAGRVPVNAGWFRYLPRFIRDRLHGRSELQAVLRNSGWLFADKILRMVVGLLVGIWVVRYLGPMNLGLLSYAGSFAGLFSVFASLGLDGMVVRELVNHPERQNVLLGSAFVLKLAAGAGTLVITMLAIAFFRGDEPLMLVLVAISAAGFIFQSLNVIDFFFQAKVLSRYMVYASTGAFLLVTLAKIAMLLVAAPLIAFAWAGLAEIILTSCFMLVAYRKNHHNVREWRYDGAVARELLRQSWPLIMANLAFVVYMRIDQVMIGEMLDDTQVGLFAAAVRISEMWYFVPLALASSVFPSIVASKKLGEGVYHVRLQTFCTIMAWLAIGVAVVVTLEQHLIVRLLYGSAYAASATVLAIHIWSGVFLALGVASGGWFIIENQQRFIFYKTLSGAASNVLLNFYLIPRYGIAGAAVATVFSQCSASFLFDFFSAKTRVIFWMKVKAFNPLSVLANRAKGA